ncbi:hypothetical protein R3P38DRAFT_2756805 [Favolaschia claudopus]|uniref:Uncharacterized protein n=1 Tax=Favolaschia claudopus TaxID=2862362 RepID=A0AAW0EHC8_9AGAR
MILPSILKSLTYRFPSSFILKSAVSVVGVAISIIAPFVKEGGNSVPVWLPTPTSSYPTRTVPIVVQDSLSLLAQVALLSGCLAISLATAGTLWVRNCPCGRLSRLPPPGPPAPPPPPPPPPAPNGAGDNANANNNDAPIGDDGDGGDYDDNPFQAGDVDDAQQGDGLAVAVAPAPEDPPPPPGGVEEDDYLPREKATRADFGWLAFLLGFLAVQLRKRNVEITDLKDAVVATVSPVPRRRSSAAHIRPTVPTPSLPVPSVPLPVRLLPEPTAKSTTIPGLLWNEKCICQAAVQTPVYRPVPPTSLDIYHVRSAMELEPTSTVAHIIQETLMTSMAVAVYSPTPVHHQLGFLDRKTFLSLALLPWLVFAGAIVLLIKSSVARTNEDADEQVLIASNPFIQPLPPPLSIGLSTALPTIAQEASTKALSFLAQRTADRIAQEHRETDPEEMEWRMRVRAAQQEIWRRLYELRLG